MLTKVFLDGPMGKEFGEEWEFEVGSPREALMMVEANKPGLFGWLRIHASKYTHYQVVVEYEGGHTEQLSEETFPMNRKMVSIRFIPHIEGSGKWGQAIAGAVLIVVGAIINYASGGSLAWIGTPMMKMGVGMLISGVIAALTIKTSNANLSSPDAEAKSLTSYTFDGPTNTTQQGVPVPLIYGRCLVGSQVISAGLSVEQLI